MKTTVTRALIGAVCTGFLAVTTACAQKVLKEWTFDRGGNSGKWVRENQVADLRVENGALCGRIMNHDPFVIGPQFDIKATPWQAVEVRLRTDCGGEGEIFWTNTTKTKYDGFSPGKETRFAVVGDNQWHDYRIFPFWQKEKHIILLRLDLPPPAAQDNGKKTFAVESIRIVSLQPPRRTRGKAAWDFGGGALGWGALPGTALHAAATGLTVSGAADRVPGIRSPGLQFRTLAKGYWVAVRMSVDAGHSATLRWASDRATGLASRRFDIEPDGRLHLYNVDMGDSRGWDGDVFYMEFSPSDAPGARACVASITVSQDPVGPAQVTISSAGLTNALNRVGTPLPFTIGLTNRGGAVAGDLRIASLQLPDGVSVAAPKQWRRLPALEPFDPHQVTLHLRATRPASGPFELRLAGAGTGEAVFKGSLEITPSLGLPKAKYVPEPKPVKSDYEIGALYFPGWPTIDRWARIWPTAPERKPVLGWYAEGNPECVDWQIKWAVENGLKFFLVDWYWSDGHQHLDHWVKAFKRARYRHYLKWAVMWANHNRPGTHSPEDQRRVTQFWIDNYFNMPEYYRIHDMPVVMIWSPQNMRRDMKGKGGVKRLLDISRSMARAAGYKGIWFIAMKWPEASTKASDIQWLKDAGFDMTSLYHYMYPGPNVKNPKRYPFDLVVKSSYPWWQARRKTGILPFLPNLSTGWDARPWHGSKSTVIYGRTVPLFRKICEEAKRFADETGIHRMVLGPLNEWGEGSYAEPNRQYGFGMYEAVRDVFCKKPAGGWPLNYGPADVGLGPYDLPMPSQKRRSTWTFDNGNQGWNPLMGISGFRAADKMLVFRTTTHDPALHAELVRIWARSFSKAVVRMKLSGPSRNPGDLQLFWCRPGGEMTEIASIRVPLVADGAFHRYALPLARNPRWRGRIGVLRLDPGSTNGMTVSIDSISLEK